ncbi:sensor histidine kinase [Alkalilimnicola sp. S0819]|uniref:sensor histidine kinase n=1 Tax=Alkalilimnicola sp. S0819 TaxID=2613922 RepID=UPI001261CA3D|nr:ATP-binding protein [Alkalilimnicola sp. S0819]KAB7627246.1 HAMP domain-containing protein [Alkalilimnicola sp. S0819]MPQ15959.1 HAMP domain-containing protein [Alkalilimnicola sp. S0819]
MAFRRLKRRTLEAWLRLGLSVLLLISLFLLSQASENSARFGALHPWLLVINALGMLVLLVLIGANIYRLVRQYRGGQTGSRLATRLMVMLVILAVVPVGVVYYFSMQFLRSGIDSWFNVRVEAALSDALSLSQASLDLRMRDLLRRVESGAAGLADVDDVMAPMALSDLRREFGASEITLLGNSGHIIASNSREATGILPNRPDEEILLGLRQGRNYVGLDPLESAGLHVRVLVNAPHRDASRPNRILHALFPMSPRINELAGSVERAYGEYGEMEVLRTPLKESFILTLSLVVLLTLLFAVWTAFYLVRRLVAPIRDLAEGTRAVAAGNYGTQLPPAGRDELGFLVGSFNDMSRRIAQVRETAKRSQAQVESQRAYLEAVLARLSSGVLALDFEGHLRTFNHAASEILGLPLGDSVGLQLELIAGRHPHFDGFAAMVQAHLARQDPEWREELTLDGPEAHRVLIASGARLPGGRGTGGYVIVFDDVTALIQAQRDAAWGEVARRLAHEIKNPLTPIQLSAERIRHKYLERMEGRDAEVLERATRTIVQQVDAMKAMVNAFSEYARPPRMELRALDLNRLIREVVELYGAEGGQPVFELDLAPALPPIAADAGRLRQLLHNLIKNALEACASESAATVAIQTRSDEGRHARQVELTLRDNGPGFAEDVMERLFDPYVTTKPRGTGLGLAIVKKIVEEHNGSIVARNLNPGARITARFPAAEAGAVAAQHA